MPKKLLLPLEEIQGLFDDIKDDATRGSLCETKEEMRKFMQSILQLSAVIMRELE